MRYGFIVILLSLTSGPALTDESASYSTAIELILETAEGICNENLAHESRSEEKSIKGDAHAEIDVLVGKLLELGIKGAGSYKEAKSKGVLQDQLAEAMRTQSSCKQGIFYSMLELFIPDSKNVNPFVSSSDKLQIPEPLSSVRSGQRFAMKRNDARLISNTNHMITLTQYSGNSPPFITIQHTDLIKGTGGSVKPRLGEAASIGNCKITYYAVSKKEHTASFFLSCS